MRHLQSCSITVSQSSQYSRNFKRIKKPTPVDGLVRPSGWNQWQRFQMAEKSFYGPWPWRFVFCWRHLSPPPQTSVYMLPVRGADARNAALGRITQLESDWNTRIMKNSLSNSAAAAAAAWLRSKFSFSLHTFFTFMTLKNVVLWI